MLDASRLPDPGTTLTGRVKRFTNQWVVFRIGKRLHGLMHKSYLAWLKRPAVGVELKVGDHIELVVKEVRHPKKSKGPVVYVGHLHTKETPWAEAATTHPVESRSICKVIAFVPGSALVEFQSGFWAWLPDAEVSWTARAKALDVLRLGAEVEVVVVAHDAERHRIQVSRRRAEAKPGAAEGEDLPPTSLRIDPSITEEAVSERVFVEGAVSRVEMNAYERDAEARAACIAHYGWRCFVCGFDFGAAYGPAAAGIIHVHHLVPLSRIGEAHEVDPVKDLRPVCPNCHAVIHIGGGTLEIDEVKRMLGEVRGRSEAGAAPNGSFTPPPGSASRA